MLEEVEAKTVGKTLGSMQFQVVAKTIADTLTCVKDKQPGLNSRLNLCRCGQLQRC